MTDRDALLRALKPFADFSSGFGRHARDDDWVLVTSPSGKRTITMGHVRAAEDALARLDATPDVTPGHTDMMVTPESLDAYLRENPPPEEATPAGAQGAWQMVPVEPTPEMIEAGKLVEMLSYCADDPTAWYPDEANIYRAMLKAAPTGAQGAWQWVPVEPTPSMMDAIENQGGEYGEEAGGGPTGRLGWMAWEAALAAAPTAARPAIGPAEMQASLDKAAETVATWSPEKRATMAMDVGARPADGDRRCSFLPGCDHNEGVHDPRCILARPDGAEDK